MNSNSIRHATTGHISTAEIHKLSDFVARLSALYPERFRGDQGLARGEEYRRVLREFTGHELTLAWAEVMDAWEKASPPPPATFLKAGKEYRTPKATGRKRDWDFVNARTKEIFAHVSSQYDIAGWSEPRCWRARMHWDRLAYIQAQFEDMGHEDAIAATARYYGLDERTMWEPPVDPPPRELPPAPPKASAPAITPRRVEMSDEEREALLAEFGA